MIHHGIITQIKINMTAVQSKSMRINHATITYHGHLNPSGTFFPQELTTKLSATGTLTLRTPSTLALIAVHRHTAASRSARPLTNEQHSLSG